MTELSHFLLTCLGESSLPWGHTASSAGFWLFCCCITVSPTAIEVKRQVYYCVMDSKGQEVIQSTVVFSALQGLGRLEWASWHRCCLQYGFSQHCHPSRHLRYLRDGGFSIMKILTGRIGSPSVCIPWMKWKLWPAAQYNWSKPSQAYSDSKGKVDTHPISSFGEYFKNLKPQFKTTTVLFLWSLILTIYSHLSSMNHNCPKSYKWEIGL